MEGRLARAGRLGTSGFQTGRPSIHRPLVTRNEPTSWAHIRKSLTACARRFIVVVLFTYRARSTRADFEKMTEADQEAV